MPRLLLHAREDDDAWLTALDDWLETMLPGASRGFPVLHGIWETPPISPQVVLARVIEVPLLDACSAAEGCEWFDPDTLLEDWRACRTLLEPPLLAILRQTTPHADLPMVEEAFDVLPFLAQLPLHTPTIPPATHTNAYLVGRDELVVVDPGSPYPDEQDRLAQYLEARLQAGARLKAIFLTHHHPDHLGGVWDLAARFAVPILAHPLAAEKVPELQGIITPLGEGDGLEIDGIRWSVLHTPGHAQDHLVLFEPESATLVLGDMVAGWGTIAVVPPEGNLNDYLSSLERLKALHPRLILPAHGPPIGGAVEKLNEFIAHRLHRERQLLAVLEQPEWQDSGATLEALVAQIYPGLPPFLVPAAAGSVWGQLERLVSQRRVEACGSYHWRRTVG
jgi:glyoxylase-like metal-dependent hydrolase (beta-lactamase superfamily II)